MFIHFKNLWNTFKEFLKFEINSSSKCSSKCTHFLERSVCTALSCVVLFIIVKNNVSKFHIRKWTSKSFPACFSDVFCRMSCRWPRALYNLKVSLLQSHNCAKINPDIVPNIKTMLGYLFYWAIAEHLITGEISK